MNKKYVLLLVNCIIWQTIFSDIYKETINKAQLFEAEYVELFFTDMHGNLKSLFQPIKYLEKIMHEGEFVDGSSIQGYTSIDGSDILVKPDINTAHILKEEHIVQFMCDVYTDTYNECESSPRYILKKTLQKAHEMGWEFFVGPEIEFYLFKTKDTQPRDEQVYFDAAQDEEIVHFKKKLLSELQKYNVPVEKVHHEVGPSQYEISIRYNDALTMADTVIQARSIIKSIARACNMYASFMPKPLFAKAGSGMHIHFSLFDTTTHTNLFYDANDTNNLSRAGKSFIAGILKHIKEISLLINPSINSYKRLVPGYEAPVYICWGKKNRSALIRLPETNGVAQATRAELRCPDSMCNPHLAFAALLEAGLEGIKNNEKLSEPMEQNLYLLKVQELQEKQVDVLPGSLIESLICFANSQLMLDMLGQDFMYKYYQSKNTEIYDFNTCVTDWECKNYL